MIIIPENTLRSAYQLTDELFNGIYTSVPSLIIFLIFPCDTANLIALRV